MNCYNCNAAINRKALFCGSCGVPQQRLVEQIMEGSQSAFESLYRYSYQNVYWAIRSMASLDEDTICDLIQNTYLKVYASISQLKEIAALNGWIKRIAQNVTIDYLRKKEKSRTIFFSDLVPDDSELDEPEFEDESVDTNPEISMEYQDRKRLISEILDELPPEQRVVLSMFFMQEMSIKEIAETLGVSESTVKSRKAYGKKKVEASVKALEKKGVNLWGLTAIGFFAWLLKGIDVDAAELPAETVLLFIRKEIFTDAPFGEESTDSFHDSASKTTGKIFIEKNSITSIEDFGKASVRKISKTAKAVLREGVKTVTKVIGKTSGTKLLIGVVTVAVVGTGVRSIIRNSSDNQVMTVNETGELSNDENTKIPNDYDAIVWDQTIDDASMISAYENILEEYRVACEYGNEELWRNSSDDNRIYDNDLFPDVITVAMITYHSDYTSIGLSNIYFVYSAYDLNGDGTKELIIGYKLVDSEYDDAILVDIYTFDGVNAVKLISDPYVGGVSNLSVYKNGTMIIMASPEHKTEEATLPGTWHYTFKHISDDCTESIDGEYYYSSFFGDDDSKESYIENQLTTEEFESIMENLTEGTDEIDDYVWIELLPEEEEQTEGANTDKENDELSDISVDSTAIDNIIQKLGYDYIGGQQYEVLYHGASSSNLVGMDPAPPVGVAAYAVEDLDGDGNDELLLLLLEETERDYNYDSSGLKDSQLVFIVCEDKDGEWVESQRISEVESANAEGYMGSIMTIADMLPYISTYLVSTDNGKHIVINNPLNLWSGSDNLHEMIEIIYTEDSMTGKSYELCGDDDTSVVETYNRLIAQIATDDAEWISRIYVDDFYDDQNNLNYDTYYRLVSDREDVSTILFLDDFRTEESSETATESIAAWKNAYIDYINEWEAELDQMAEEEGLNRRSWYQLSYSLIYVDNDDIPELYVGGYVEAMGDKICTIGEDNTVVECQLGRLSGSSYIERSGMVCNFSGNMGGYYLDFYELNIGEFTQVNDLYCEKLVESYYADDEECETVTYYWYAQEVTEEEFYENWNAIMNLDDLQTPYEVTYSAEEIIAMITEL